MNEFNFGRPVKICGKEYRIDLGREDIRTKLQELIPQVKEKQPVTVALAQAQALIDLLLGSGAYDDLFAGRIAAKEDIAALLNFILGEINAAYGKN